jgi:hypothetical protein
LDRGAEADVRTICEWCRRDGQAPDVEDPSAIPGLCEDHISRFMREVDAALRGQTRIRSEVELPAPDRLHRSARRVRETVLQQVGELLLRNFGSDLCDACVAAELGLRAAEAEAAAARLAASSDFLRDEWRCGRCGSRKIVTRARAAHSGSRASPSTAA